MAKHSKTSVMSIRVQEETSKKLTKLAKRMGISKQELVNRIITNGVDDAENIVKGAENPIINLAMKMAVQLAGTPEEVKRTNRELDAIRARAKGSQVKEAKA